MTMTNDALLEKLRKIRLVIYDVDGVMTDSRIVIGNHENDEQKFFNVKDGLGVKHLQKLSIKQIILTGKQSNLVTKRFEALGVDEIFQGKTKKIETFYHILEKYNLKPENILMMGDDLPDLPVLKKSGVAISTKDGHLWLDEYLDYKTQKKGGKGAVREITDLILEAHNLKDLVINEYLENGEMKPHVL